MQKGQKDNKQNCFLLFSTLVLLILNLRKALMKNEITISDAQEQVDQWIKTVGVRYFNELTNMTILMEEVGEMARIMSRTYGEQSFKESDKGKDLGDEMADVLWVLICLANQTGVDLTEALKKNFEKKNIRDIDRHKNNKKLK
jgi:NTP pyrophosphatase (non-canonical NTP hydrolase)